MLLSQYKPLAQKAYCAAIVLLLISLLTRFSLFTWLGLVLLVLCCAVFALFLARLAWLQFAMADHYAQKMAEASSASYTLPQHAARGAITDRSGTVLAQDETVYDVYLRVPAPPGTNLRETVNTIAALTGGKDVETQLAAFCSAVSAGELPVTQGLDLSLIHI